MSSSYHGKLKGLRISVCCGPDTFQSEWTRALQRERADVSTIWPPPRERMSADMDILIVDYFPQLSDLIPWLPGEAQAAMIIMLPTDGQYDDATVLSLAPQSVLQNPISNRLMLTTVKTAWSQFRYEQRLLNRVERLDENVRSLRDVERAKLIIMTKHNLDEDAAYRHLRETAMSQQQSVSSVATNIVQSAQGTH